MTRLRPRRPRVEESVLELPPLDGDRDAHDETLDRDDEVLEPDDGGTLIDEPGLAEDTEVESLLSDSESGWLDDSAEADDADVGDLADEIDAGEAHSWLDDGVRDAGDESLDAESDVREDRNDDRDGPDGESLESLIDDASLPALDDSDENSADDESAGDADASRAHHAPAAFALEAPASVNATRVLTDGAIIAATLAGDRLVLCGDGAFSVSVSALVASAEPVRQSRELRVPFAAPVTSVVTLNARVLVAALADGRILRSDDAGALWTEIAALGSEDGAPTPVDLVVDPRREGRLWARAHGGGLFRSDDTGGHWDGPIIAQPVRVIAADAQAEGIVAASALAGAASLLRIVDREPLPAADLGIASAPTVLACDGGVWAIAFARGPGVVSVDGGGSYAAWPLLEGATAMLVTQTDDGAPQILAAVYDDASDRATILRAAIAHDGGPRAARRVIDIDAALGGDEEPRADEADARVDALVPLDPAGRRVLVITGRGVFAMGRDER